MIFVQNLKLFMFTGLKLSDKNHAANSQHMIMPLSLVNLVAKFQQQL